MQPIRELPTSPASVDAVKEKIRQEAQEKNGQQATTEVRNRPFTPADVRAALDAYKASQDVPAIQHLMETASVQVSGMEVKIRVVSILQMNQLDSIRQELLAYLKNALQNDGVLLLAEKTEQQPVAAEAAPSSKPYTPAERFEFMARKNPALLHLKDRLGLDLGA